jgi:uncharacterized protein (DUF2235 family)
MKRLVICCDGTWNRADHEDKDGKPCVTNVIKIATRVAKRDGGTLQIVYYDQGVGTGNTLDRFSGGAFGQGLAENINDAYRFLVANYEPGDEIYLFGFSRGAFTARSIGGMIRKCGILRREFSAEYGKAVALYRSLASPTEKGPTDFRTRFSLGGAEGTKIRFVGVWDTVGALGIPLRGLRWLTRKDDQFHDVQLSSAVERAYHALAIDERRGPFEPTLWDYVPKDGQIVEQVWFCGVHSDIGGGYSETGLSDIALDWMLGKAQQAGLALDPAVLAARPLHLDPMSEIHNSKTGLYRATPGLDRPIGLTPITKTRPTPVNDPTQSVHPSVLKRWDGDKTYRPPQLTEYFRRTGDPARK